MMCFDVNVVVVVFLFVYLCECMSRERNDLKKKQTRKIDSLCFHSSDEEKIKYMVILI
jgi:hypothetical protein